MGEGRVGVWFLDSLVSAVEGNVEFPEEISKVK